MPKAFATLSSLYRPSPIIRYLDIATVSITVKSHSKSCLLQLASIKLISKSELWATITESLQNSINLGNISSIFGASITISSLMLVNFSILKGIGISGLTKVLNLSIIFPFSTLTAPISIILSLFALKPVVSKSKTTYLSFKC